MVKKSVNISTIIPGDQDQNQPNGEDYLGHDFEHVLNLIGFGTTQWLVLISSGLLLMMVINETVGVNIITIASQCDFSMTSIDKATLGSAAFLGIFFSSYFWGYFSDIIGRRSILLYSTLIGNILSFASLCIPSFWVFVCVRFFVGIFIAGASSTTYAYLGEFCVVRLRPIVINYSSMFVGISMMYTPVVAWLVLSMDWKYEMWNGTLLFRPWRLLIFFNLLPGLIAIIIMYFLPESPKFLLSIQREKEALEATNWICMRNLGKSLNELHVYKLKSETIDETRKSIIDNCNICGILKNMFRETRPLFQRPFVINFLISCVVMNGLFLSSTGMGLWFPEIQNQLGLNTKDKFSTVCQVIKSALVQAESGLNDTICSDTVTTKSLMDSLSSGVCIFVGFIFLGCVIKGLGRKLVIIIALTISFLSAMILLWLTHPTGIVISFCIFIMMPSLCISVLSGIVVDLVPTHLRGKAVCICLMIGRSGSIIGSNIIALLLRSNCHLTFSLFGGIVLACAGLTIILPG